MSGQEFKAIFEILIPRLVQYISEQRHINDQEALTALYESLLYEKLENEKTKLWHLSVPMLYDLFDEEMRTGHITFPEEA
ncbi:MAG: hypothetical protein LBT52_03935 [Clostridiales Family XIII bacterium]|jgi:hypothetical protein|nr:hypothetical protein [Clostridiales Family XIII bacterium]